VAVRLRAAIRTRRSEGNFLRHPEDTRDVIDFRAPTPVDEFVLKYQKPQ
jgi:hypothetical protein